MKLSTLFLTATLSLASFSAFAETVNINKANAATLQHYLVGVGESRAKGIIKYRQDHKKFNAIEEIMKVKGIGEAIFKKNKSILSLSKGATKMPAKLNIKSVQTKNKVVEVKK